MESFVYSGTPKKVCKILSENLTEYSYDYFRKLLRKGDVKINGKRIKDDVLVGSGDEITAYCTPKPFTPEVVYSDVFIIVFNKYTGISSEKFSEKAQSVYPGIILCHRLDTNTSGLLLFAKNEQIFEEIKKLFSSHLVEKHYYCEVYGDFPSNAFYNDYLEKDEKEGIVRIYSNDKKGRLKVSTKCTLLDKKDGYSCLDVEPITGRTHQIRAHLAFHGYPVLGDGKYGDVAVNKRYHTHIQHLTSYKLIFHSKDSKLLSYLAEKPIELKK